MQNLLANDYMGKGGFFINGACSQWIFIPNMVYLKKIHFVGTARRDIREFPRRVREDIGYALYQAQNGAMAMSAKPLKGFGGAGVLEVVESFGGDAYRAAYTAQYEKVLYVLHCFQKKSKRGAKTPRRDMNMIYSRLRIAEEDYQLNYQERRK